MNIYTRALFAIAMSLATLSCVPSVRNVYTAPEVSGQVIELTDLSPAQGVKVFHERTLYESSDEHGKVQQVFSNLTGKFRLNSLSSVEFKLLFAGHMLQEHFITLQSKKLSIDIIVYATKNSSSIDVIEVPIIVIDQNPEIISNTPNNDSLSYSDLEKLFRDKNLLSSCNKKRANNALKWLNTSRKLYWKTENNSNNIYLLSSYFYTQKVWMDLKRTCTRTAQNYERLDDVFEAISHESNSSGDLSLVNYRVVF